MPERAEEFVPESETNQLSNKPTLVSRRSFLRGLGLGALGLMRATAEAGPSAHLERRERKPRSTWEESITTGVLAGKRAAGTLLGDYFGVKERVFPSEVKVNFPKQLEYLWQRKMNRYRKQPEVIEAAKQICAEYANYEPTRVSLGTYSDIIQGTVAEVVEKIDLQRYAQVKTLGLESAKIFENIVRRISYQDLLVVCMTEIMPLSTGSENLAALDVLLRTAGMEYVESIPALFDKYVSFGPYQFTKFAVGEDKRGFVGASKLNGVLPEGMRLPRKVSGLRGEVHHIAGTAFMIENLANLLQLVEEQPTREALLQNLEKVLERNPEELLLFMTSAHHAPLAMNKTAIKWLSDNAQKPFLDYCVGEPAVYARRLARNREAFALA